MNALTLQKVVAEALADVGASSSFAMELIPRRSMAVTRAKQFSSRGCVHFRLHAIVTSFAMSVPSAEFERFVKGGRNAQSEFRNPGR